MSAKSIFLTVAAVIAPAVVSVTAQSNSIINILGTVEQINATSISLKDERGAVERFKLAPDVLVVQNKIATLADVKPNDFVASAAVRGADGKLHSIELRIFPEAMRGVGEGQRPMSAQPDDDQRNCHRCSGCQWQQSHHGQARWWGA
jgi:hypothetical protein